MNDRLRTSNSIFWTTNSNIKLYFNVHKQYLYKYNEYNHQYFHILLLFSYYNNFFLIIIILITT